MKTDDTIRTGRVLAITLSIVAILVSALTGIAWARIEHMESRVQRNEEGRYGSDQFRDEVLRRLDRIEDKLDKLQIKGVTKP